MPDAAQAPDLFAAQEPVKSDVKATEELSTDGRCPVCPRGGKHDPVICAKRAEFNAYHRQRLHRMLEEAMREV